MEYFDYECRVRYADTDKMGISYYANYFVWFEAARTEYFRAIGLPYTECEKKGYFLPVVETGARYQLPSTYDDLLIVRASVAEIKASSMRFEYQVLKVRAGLKPAPSQLIATGFSTHVFVDKTLKPCRLPAEIRNKVTLKKSFDR